jgi:2-desacetyl-2-hydroxyethyl bacteriochlorophyllide A dehydrogenase
MRQAIMISPGTIEFRQVPDPGQPGDHQVLLKIKRIGICGSDVHVYHGKHPATPYPVVQGHEYSAVVEATGKKVRSLQPGMRVTGRPQLVCRECGPCKRGQYNTCQQLKVQGFQAPGVAQDLFVIDKEQVVILAGNMNFEQGAMVEPSAVAAHATNRADLKGKNVLVSGAGTIGNLVAQFARARGAKKVLITDLSDHRLAIAKKCGIVEVLNIKDHSIMEGIESCFGNEGFQAGFEAAGAKASLDSMMQYIDTGGDVVVLGVYEKNPVVNMYFLGEHELNVYGSMMYRHEDYETAVKMIASRQIITGPLLSKTFPFEEYREAYRFIDEKGDKIMKVMIEM